MGCPAGFILDPTGAVCIPDDSSTDPTYFTAPSAGSIQLPTDDIITPPQVNADGCYVGEIDPVTGDSIASCSGTAGGGVVATGVTPTPVSPSVWASLSSSIGSLLGTVTGTTPVGSIPAGYKKCSNGQLVLTSATCPVVTSSGISPTVLLILAALVAFVIYEKVRG